MLETYRSQLCSSYRKVSVLPEGGACPAATRGYQRLVAELAQQLDPETCWTIVVDSGTGMTATAIAMAIERMGLPWRVDAVVLLKGQEDTIARQALERIHPLRSTDDTELPVQWFARVRPRRFGKVFEDEVHECLAFAKQTGVLLDPMYTLAAWKHTQVRRAQEMNSTVIIHTGGGLNLWGVAQRFPDYLESAP